MISSKYMDMACDGKRGIIRCRICQKVIYEASTVPTIDPERMEAALDHLDTEHQVSRVDIILDSEKSFEDGIRREGEKRAAKSP